MAPVTANHDPLWYKVRQRLVTLTLRGKKLTWIGWTSQKDAPSRSSGSLGSPRDPLCQNPDIPLELFGSNDFQGPAQNLGRWRLDGAST